MVILATRGFKQLLLLLTVAKLNCGILHIVDCSHSRLEIEKKIR